jgi:hypothetical protein
MILRRWMLRYDFGLDYEWAGRFLEKLGNVFSGSREFFSPLTWGRGVGKVAVLF